MALSHAYLKGKALDVVGDNIKKTAFTQKQLIEANNFAANLCARTLGLTYVEKKNILIDSNGYGSLDNETITTLKVWVQSGVE